VIFTVNLAEQRYVCEGENDGVMFMCVCVDDAVLCGKSNKCGSWSLTGCPPLYYAVSINRIVETN